MGCVLCLSRRDVYQSVVLNMKAPNIKVPAIVKAVVPTPTAVVRESLIVLGGVLIAAFVISRFPALKKFVGDASITVNDKQGNNIW